MKIIIVGCGKVGLSLTCQLAEEGHDITVVDTDADKARRVAVTYDVLGIEGNGTSYKVLEMADIEHADVLIAVTQSDEVNILCCVIAKKSGCRTIARVRNPIYSEERDIIKRELGISLIINPERSAAMEIRQLLQFPAALEVDVFANGNIELISFKIPSDSMLIGHTLKEIALQKHGMLLCVADRGGNIMIPDGSYTAQAGDVVSVITTSEMSKPALKKIGVAGSRIKNVTIIGGGGVSFYLASMLINVGLNVKIIEQDRTRCDELSEILPDVTVIYGDGISQELYKEEHLASSDAIIVATGVDEENIIFSLYAMSNSEAKVITKVSHLSYDNVIESLDLDSIVNPLDIAAEYILHFVRGLNNRIESSAMELLYRLKGGKVEAIEFKINEQSRLIGHPIMEMHIKKNTIIAAISRSDEVIIPGGTDSFMPGDSVIIVTANRGYHSIDDILE